MFVSPAAKCVIVAVLLALIVVIILGGHVFNKRQRYKLYDEQKIDSKLNALEFVRPPEAQHLNCAQLITDSETIPAYVQERLTYKDPPWPDDLPTDCQSILRRNYFQLERIFEEEERFPLAFVRTVYRDYRQIEMELAATYAPQNTYCYAIDAKSSKTFHSRMNALSACLPNIYITRTEYPMDSAGHNISHSFMECLRLIRPMRWRYVMLLQNHDIALKTNQELIKIFNWYNGTNDVSARKAHLKRIRPGINWSFKYLDLFKNKTRNTRVHNQQPPILQMAKSLAQVALSREAVNFMMEELNLNRLLDAFEWNAHGVDEQLMGTLNSNDAIDLPGGFTLQCLRRGYEVSSLMRLTFWHNNTDCQSGIKRHRICIFGMEDLTVNLANSPYLFANKFMQEKDFGALSCWHELMFNRTHRERGLYRLDRYNYLNMPQVRFNRERQEDPANFKASNFRC